MIIAALVLAALAALLHVYIFYMESIAWTSPRVRSTFGTSPEEAQATKEMAYNQGFYNLFLAGGAVVGLALYWTTLHEVGFGLIFFCGTCMVLASFVLVTTGRRFWRAALLQGALPLAALILFVIAENA